MQFSLTIIIMWPIFPIIWPPSKLIWLIPCQVMVFWHEESKNDTRNYPSSSVHRLLKILASLPLLGFRSKKGMWPKIISKQNGLT